MRILRSVVAALTLMVSSALSGQRLPIKSFSASDGLPGGGINRIVRDSHGFLWFCSTEGIARFDGHDFVRFGADAGWPAHAVNDFLQARDGSCWIATSQGLFRLDMAVPGGPPTGGGRRVVPVSSRNLSVTCLFEDRTGVLWCGTHAGLFRVDRSPGPGSLRSINLGFPEKTTDDPIVTALAGKDGGGLWIGAGSGLYSLEPDGRVGRYTKADGLPDTWVRSLAVAGDGSFWVATRKGVGRLRLSAGASRLEVLETYTRGNGFPDLVSGVLLRTGEGKIIVGTGVGLSLIERAKVDSYGLDEGLEVPVLALAEGARGELWVGTDHGAQRWILDGLTTYVPSDRPFQRINSLLEDRTGALVAVTANDTLFKIRRMVGNRLLSSTLRMPPGSHRPGWGWHQPLLQDHLGAWWCATDQGLCRFEVTPSAAALPGARHARTYKVQQISGSGSDEVFAVFEDSRGDIWFSTVANPLNGLGRWVRAGDRIEGFNGKAGIPERPSLATAFAEDQAGNAWVAFNGAGLGRFRNGRFDLFTEADGIPACWIRSMMLDGSGRLWVACSRGGVRIIEDPTAAVPHVRAFTTDQGLAGNSIWSCVEDRWGRVYVGTGAGIDRVDLEHGRVLHLSEAQGLASGVPRAAIRDREGTLWFGLSGGLSRYVPPAPKPEQPPPIFLISLRVAGTARALPESGAPEWDLPDLPAGQNRIEVDFTSPGGLGGNTLRYQYRLRGVSDDWSRASLDRRVDLANLAPGHYHFQVRAMGEEGRTSDPPAEFRFTILPPSGYAGGSSRSPQAPSRGCLAWLQLPAQAPAGGGAHPHPDRRRSPRRHRRQPLPHRHSQRGGETAHAGGPAGDGSFPLGDRRVVARPGGFHGRDRVVDQPQAGRPPAPAGPHRAVRLRLAPGEGHPLDDDPAAGSRQGEAHARATPGHVPHPEGGHQQRAQALRMPLHEPAGGPGAGSAHRPDPGRRLRPAPRTAGIGVHGIPAGAGAHQHAGPRP